MSSVEAGGGILARESFLLVHDARRDRADKLIRSITARGDRVRSLRCDQRNALDLGREAFYELSKAGPAPVVAGIGRGVALAVAIAQRCPASGLICLWPDDKRNGLPQRRLTRDVARNLFLIVAPTLLVVDDAPGYLARRLCEQLPSDTLTVVEADGGCIMSQSALNAILERLRHTHDTKKLILRQILGVE